LGPACGVEPSLHGVFRRGLRRVESQQVPTVEVEHGGEETMGQGFSESSAGAEALRLPQMPRGAPRGSRFGGRRDDGLTRSERAPHNPGHVSENGEQQERQGGEEQIVARGRRDPQGLEPLEEPVPLLGQPEPGAAGLAPPVLSSLEHGPQRSAQRVRLDPLRNDAHARAAAMPRWRPRPSVPPGSGSSTAACTATERPGATTNAGMMKKMSAKTTKIPVAKPAASVRPSLPNAKSSASDRLGSLPR